VRDHGNDLEHGEKRPARPQSREIDDGGKVARAATAAVSGQRAAIGPSGALGLQRAVGNAGLASVLGAAPDEAAVQREHAGGEAEAPLYESHGDDEEEI
jgi:hypothetical protein